MTYTQTKSLIEELNEIDLDHDEKLEAINNINDLETDFTVGDWRFIHQDSIDDVLKEEFLADEYMLGCFSAWFIAGICDLDFDTVEKAQKAENYELLGALMAKNIDEVVAGFISTDGYGHHFNSYDGNEYEVGDYLAFKS